MHTIYVSLFMILDRIQIYFLYLFEKSTIDYDQSPVSWRDLVNEIF